MARSKGDTADGKTSKRKMVESAFDALGDRVPGELRKYIKDKFDADMEMGMISTYKSQLKKSRGLGKTRKAKSKPAGEPAAGRRVGIKDVIAVKQLIDRVGARQLHSIIDAVGGL